MSSAAVVIAIAGGTAAVILKQDHHKENSADTGPTQQSGSTTGGNAGAETVATVKQAVADVSKRGFTVFDKSTYDPRQTLRVLIGIKKGSATGSQQKAFFFVKGRRLGTDTSETSAGISVAWHNNVTVALEYRLYRSSDPQCCPTGGSATVRYHWDGVRLAPLDPIPPASYGARLSRR